MFCFLFKNKFKYKGNCLKHKSFVNKNKKKHLVELYLREH